MAQRFHLPPPSQQPPAVGDEFEADAERAHYLCRVLRHRTGDTVPCFDGAGQTFDCTMLDANPRRCRLRVTAVADPVPRPAAETHMVLGLLKGAAMDRAVAQCVELGASAITLVSCARSNVRLEPARSDNKRSHWQKIIVGACEQSGQLFVPALRLASSLPAVLEAAEGTQLVLKAGAARLLGDPGDQVTLFVGPEGGWAPDEDAVFERTGVTAVGLGELVLRAETVPAAALSLVNYLRSV